MPAEVAQKTSYAPAPKVRDGELVARCRNGDSSAMRELYRRHSGRVLAMAWRMVGTESEAEDVLQEAFLRAWRGLRNYRGDSSFGTWLYRIAINLCRDRARGKQHAALEEEPAYTPRDSDGIARRRLSKALSELARGYREVLLLHDMMDLGHAEIAKILGISVGTSKSQLHKARAQMRALLAS